MNSSDGQPQQLSLSLSAPVRNTGHNDHEHEFVNDFREVYDWFWNEIERSV